MKKMMIACIVLCFSAVYSFGQTAQFYSKTEGLPSKLVSALLEDSQGNIWAGTNKGLAKIENGRVTQTFTKKDGMPFNYVTTLFEDSKGIIWVGTNKGLGKYDGTNWQVFRTQEGLSHLWVNVIKEGPDGKIYVGTKNGITVVDGNMLTKQTTANGLPNNCIYDIIFMDAASYYSTFEGKIGINKDGVWNYVKEGKGYYNPIPYSILILPGALLSSPGLMLIGIVVGVPLGYALPYKGNYTRLDVDANGHVWMAAYGGGLYKYDGANWTSHVKMPGIPKTKIATDVVCDANGEVWATFNKGIVKFDGSQWQYISKKDHLLPNNVALTIIEDKAGNHWVGTRKGLAKIMD